MPFFMNGIFHLKHSRNMQSLYRNGLEEIYDAMYQTFIDYDEEFNFYHDILNKYRVKQLLEIGCGTGNLAKRFIETSLDYLGLDLSEDMLRLARLRNPNGNFINGDMTQFTLNESVDAIIITGRSTSYLLNNASLNKALNSIYTNLNSEGFLIFDFIDANRFFKIIKDGAHVQHSANYNGTSYKRESYMSLNPELDNHMFTWDASYIETSHPQYKILAKDTSTVRAFTVNEWELLLELAGFNIQNIIDRKSYAFDTYVMVAKKK